MNSLNRPLRTGKQNYWRMLKDSCQHHHWKSRIACKNKAAITNAIMRFSIKHIF